MRLSTDNPFAHPSSLPFRLPDFAAIKFEHLKPAIMAGMAEAEEEVAAITANPEPPTIANTLEAFERSGALLDRALAVFHTLTAADSTDDLQTLDEELAPLLAAHHDTIFLDQDLFDRLSVLHDQRQEYDAETAWVLSEYRKDFIAAGALLDEAGKEQLRHINERLTELETRFDNMLLAETNDLALHVLDEADLNGMPDDGRAAAKQAAEHRGLPGYLLELMLYTQQPAEATLTDQSVRARLHDASTRRGSRGGPHDTRATLLEIVQLRAERAELLGFPHHAEYAATDGTAGHTADVMAMLEQLVPAATRNARHEAAALQRALAVDDPTAKLMAHDWALYAERVRRERFAVDDATLRPYFELDRVIRDGVFYAAHQLYGITFAERFDLPAYHPEVRIFDVLDEDGAPIGLFLGDYYTRASKRGGAWMDNLVDQSTLLGDLPVVINTLNIVKPPAGTPTLLTLDEVATLFHEFGHALHGLFSKVRYPSASGTNVPRDFVEFPSQVNEMWVLHPEVLSNYARHIETGAELPPTTVDALRASQTFNQGFATTEYLGAALLDQAWHQLSDHEAGAVTDVLSFEEDVLRGFGFDPDLVPPRYRSAYFHHVFGGGYAAGYYGYIWSEVLDADTVAWFTERGGLTRANGDRFRDVVLSRGGSCDPMAAVRELLGREPKMEPLLRRRGLA